jgi:23S rRNA pseudouridine2605 synthase
MRLNQFLARAGHGSRRACDDLVRSGVVEINGDMVRRLATQVGPSDIVKIHGQVVRLTETLTAALHKPEGYLCSTVPERGERTIFDLLPKDWPRVFYVGRLDKDSEGLLIITNDGALGQKLTHPRAKVPKTYEVMLDKEFDFTKDAERLRRGVMLREGRGRFDEIYRAARLTVKVVLTQGIKRQIRLMFHFAGYKVRRLVRTQIGGLSLGKLAPGKWRLLNAEDLERLLHRDGGTHRRPHPALPTPSGGLQPVPISAAPKRVEQARPRRPEVRPRKDARAGGGDRGRGRPSQSRPPSPRGPRRPPSGRRPPQTGQRRRVG